ncbi:MAG: acyltransferase family protein, partial [Chitinophagaceae bacterium]
MKRLSNFFTIESSSDRIFGLDLLRAFAIFFVVFLHGSLILPQRLAVYQFYVVFDGVSIFFVLSGFLIGRIIIKTFNTEHLSYHCLSSFWIKRWFRTLPNYFIILLALILLQVISGKSFNGAPLWKYFLFLQNFNSPQPGFFSESWSLSVEEWFYLLIPLFIFLLAY